MKPIFIALTFSLFSLTSFAQIWPVSPMIRFGNTVYYKLEKNTKFELYGTNLAFDKRVGKRYFDVLSIKDSIEILIEGSKVYFKQKNRKEPRQHKEILFYSRRKLRNDQSKIKYLKLIKVTDNSIIAKANIRYKKHLFARQKNIEISREEIDGIFVGTGQNYRILMSTAVVGGVVIFL